MSFSKIHPMVMVDELHVSNQNWGHSKQKELGRWTPCIQSELRAQQAKRAGKMNSMYPIRTEGTASKKSWEDELHVSNQNWGHSKQKELGSLSKFITSSWDQQ